MATSSTKIIVSNQAALQTRYGANLAKVTTALDALIAADKARGIQTRVVYLDQATDMSPLKATPVVDPANDRQNKDAIDAVHTALMPDYLVILGGPDIVPLQALSNPMNDGDPNVPSDLPYACDAGYSTAITDFIAPTRVVGRIPGITGSSDPQALVTALQTATTLQARSKSDFSAYFSVSVELWTGSTSQSLTNIFGTSQSMVSCPPNGPNWANDQLSRLAHFFNVHGSDSDPRWFGQGSSGYPVAVESWQIAGKLSPGAIVSSEACYGGQLFTPIATDQLPICNVYLLGGVSNFVGSSNVAYGPASGQGQADLITQYVMIKLLGGASAGRAMLEARQKFISGTTPMHPADQKTVAQFNLLGDPSNHPVATSTEALAKAGPTSSSAEVAASARGKRRVRLMAEGETLKSLVGFAIEDKSLTVSKTIEEQLDTIIRQEGLGKVLRQACRVHPGKMLRSAMFESKASAVEEVVHMLYGRAEVEAPDDRIPADKVVIAREQSGTIVSVEVLHRK